MIYSHGRIDLGSGILENLTDGGPGVRNPWEQGRKLMREKQVGHVGVPKSVDHRSKIAAAKRKFYINNPADRMRDAEHCRSMNKSKPKFTCSCGRTISGRPNYLRHRKACKIDRSRAS